MITTPSTTLTNLDLSADSQSRGRFHRDRSDLKIVGPLYTNGALKKLLLFPLVLVSEFAQSCNLESLQELPLKIAGRSFAVF